jgi:PHD/YefM family antitoxin component YafN of YafNO toxin-antitoxin module
MLLDIISVADLRKKDILDSVTDGNPKLLYRGKKSRLVIITEEDYKKLVHADHTRIQKQ